MILETSVTFDTDAEAVAFMRGFVMAGMSEHVSCRIDLDEPFAINVDVVDDVGMEHYLESNDEARRAKLGC